MSLRAPLAKRNEEARQENYSCSNPSVDIWDLGEEPDTYHCGPDQFEKIERHYDCWVGFLERLANCHLRN